MKFKKHDMFVMPMLEFEIPDWHNVKQELLLAIESSKWLVSPEGMISDFHTEDGSPPYLDRLVEIVTPMKEAVEGEIGKKFKAAQAWYQTTSEGTSHNIHNHGGCGVSQVIFLDFNPEIHYATRFVSNNLMPFSYLTQEYKPKLKEGDTIFFPSHVNHYQPGNASEVPRTILALNWTI